MADSLAQMADAVRRGDGDLLGTWKVEITTLLTAHDTVEHVLHQAHGAGLQVRHAHNGGWLRRKHELVVTGAAGDLLDFALWLRRNVPGV